MKEEKIIVFDGVCGLCNYAVTLLINIDTQKRFKYTALQGRYVEKLDIEEGIDSIIFYENGQLYYKSTAILRIVRSLGGLWVTSGIFYIIPRFVRDYIYDSIAKYRYRIFGKEQICRMPKEGEEKLFLD